MRLSEIASVILLLAAVGHCQTPYATYGSSAGGTPVYRTRFSPTPRLVPIGKVKRRGREPPTMLMHSESRQIRIPTPAYFSHHYSNNRFTGGDHEIDDNYITRDYLKYDDFYLRGPRHQYRPRYYNNFKPSDPEQSGARVRIAQASPYATGVAYSPAPAKISHTSPAVATYKAPVAYQSPQVYQKPRLIPQVQSAKPVLKAATKATNLEDEYPPDPNPQYNFAFDIQDDEYTNFQNRQEKRDGGTIQGSYSVVDPDGYVRTVTYTATPEGGFQAKVTREPTDVKIKFPVPTTAPEAVKEGVSAPQYSPQYHQIQPQYASAPAYTPRRGRFPQVAHRLAPQ